MKGLRKKDKQISTEEARELLTSSEYGVLSTTGVDGQPYSVPLNYVYRDNALYFHCALIGHKLDNIKENPKVSFCVVGDVEILPSKFSTNFVSVVAFGVASEAMEEERANGLFWLLEKYSPDYMEEGEEYINKMGKITKVIKIDIHHISGKKAPAKKINH